MATHCAIRLLIVPMAFLCLACNGPDGPASGDAKIPSTQSLLTRLDDPSPTVRRSAADALAEHGDMTAYWPLVKRAATDDNAAVRRSAAMAAMIVALPEEPLQRDGVTPQSRAYIIQCFERDAPAVMVKDEPLFDAIGRVTDTVGWSSSFHLDETAGLDGDRPVSLSLSAGTYAELLCQLAWQLSTDDHRVFVGWRNAPIRISPLAEAEEDLARENAWTAFRRQRNDFIIHRATQRAQMGLQSVPAEPPYDRPMADVMRELAAQTGLELDVLTDPETGEPVTGDGAVGAIFGEHQVSGLLDYLLEGSRGWRRLSWVVDGETLIVGTREQIARRIGVELAGLTR